MVVAEEVDVATKMGKTHMTRKSGMDDEGRLPSAMAYQRLMARPVRFGDSLDEKMRRLDERDEALRRWHDSQRWSQNVERRVREREASLRKQENIYLVLCFACACLALVLRALG